MQANATCRRCGAAFHSKSSRLASGRGLYCSRKCFDAQRAAECSDKAIVAARFWAKVDRSGGPDACWLWTDHTIGRGYGRMHLNGGQIAAHRLAWVLTHGPIPDGLYVCHTCDCPPCCNPAHLWLGTTQENTADRDRKGRQARAGRSGPRLYPERLSRGERHYAAKLTAVQVEAIRAEYARGGINQTALGRKYGIGQTAVSKIVRGEKWKHLG